LTAKFLETYEPHHERADVAGYGHYFLGSIIISDKDGVKFIIDGQPSRAWPPLRAEQYVRRLSHNSDRRRCFCKV
jgi:hypothetical protein